MPLIDIETGVSDHERAIVDRTHQFAEDVLRPAGQALDRLEDPAEVIASDSVLWEVFDQYRKLEVDEIRSPDSELEPLQRARLDALINEELGWGDAGLAISLGASTIHRLFAELSGDPELIERFSGPDSTDIGCWAITEPDHGSDTLAYNQPTFADPSVKANCVARREGDEYVISGQKSAWVSNGSIATVATLFCTIEPSQGLQGGGVCLVPLDLPGVSRGKPLDKLGQRSLNQGEIFFDDVRVPAQNMVIGADAYAISLEGVLAMANALMGTVFVGLARAAFEHALEYAKQRVQGGTPIFEHQSVKSRLFNMFSQVEAARSLARRVALHTGTAGPLVQYSIASKTFCTTTAFEVASAALQILGGNGLSREYPVEKLLRDARASMIEDGCNEVLGLVAATKL